MFRVSRFTSYRRFSVCLAVSYSLLFSFVAPLRPAQASGAAEFKPESAVNYSSKLRGLPATMEQTGVQSRGGELLVRFRAGSSEQQKAAALASHGAQRQRRLRGESGWEKFELPLGQNPETVSRLLVLDPAVEIAEPNFLIEKDQVTPDDPSFGEQWPLRNSGQAGGQQGSDINVPTAWQITTGAQSTVIAVIDSGIDFSHPDLSDNRWTNLLPGPEGDLHGWDYVTDDGAIKDEHGHGTSVAGIIAAEGNNAIGISGVMWRASLMSLRVLDNTGTGDIAMAIEAIDYAVAHGAQVINISWGTNAESIALKEAIQRALRRNVVVVCSAGNGGRNLDAVPYYPASFKLRELVTVAATNNLDELTSWSNWGGGVTIAAPGTNVLTTRMGGGYWSVSGTSAAAPLVTGVAGLMKSVRPMLNPHVVAKTLSDEARPVASLAGKVAASGVVNASGSVATLQGSANPPAPFPTPGYGSGGTGPGGTFSTTPPSRIVGPPGLNLPNLDQVRNSRPEQPGTREPIQSNLVCADCDPQSGGGGGSYHPTGDPNFSTAREQPRNETGQPAVDLGSRNFNWSLPLLSLPGRASLDLNLSLSYNSLVWTKDGSFIKYNADLGSPAPGFRIGLPILQQRFLNSQTGSYAYMMVTPSGSGVELRQVGSSNIYESQDSSYTQLDVSNPNAPLVRTTDGTQFSFIPVTINSEYRCTQIKDRNGNYLSAAYDTTNGHLQTITDTLGRVITFIYDGNSNLERIRQTWAGVAHDWATFSYGQVYVAPNFGGGLLVNGPNNNYVTVLTQVSLHDGSYVTFNYNAAFGQVNRINSYAADTHLRSYVSYNLDTSSGQTDCPRFTERRDWAEFGVMGQSQEVVTSYSVASDNSWSEQTAPDGTRYKEFFHTSGWKTGLTSATEVWSNNTKKKWTTVDWTQDDTNLSYQKNPRVAETNVYDADGNRKRVAIDYGAYASYGLPYQILEYAADGSTPWRSKYFDYNLNAVYVNRRIVGLLSASYLFDHTTNAYLSKVSFEYDWDNTTNTYLINQGTATQHDGTNYSQSLIGGRGNLTAVRRWNIGAINDWNQAMWVAFTGYNTTGSVIFQADGLGRETRFTYSDAFSDAVNRNTFAYPTTIADADNHQSTAQYNYDFGAVTRTEDPKGAIQTMSYDAATRITQVTNPINGAYTRWVYTASMGYVQQFSTIQAGAGESYSIDYFDGGGRLRASAGEHPGSGGGYWGAYVKFDSMGRMVRRSNPAEVAGDWTPVGDDVAGWVETSQTYDWKGRPLVQTNPDGSTTEASYGGCGCAGGEVTTVRDERGRRRKLTKDVLGRLKQVEELNWDQSIYSTTTYAYNVRDQITSSNQAGQTRSFIYDGHGRLQSRTTPEQGTTTYSYYGNDAAQTITDARGATTTFGYNNRGLVNSITYGAPAGVAATSNVTFGYDNAGNRTSMTDGLGSVSYVYNTLSQLTSETRTFTGAGSYTLSYAYNLGGELASLTNPWGAQVGYSYDKMGRPKSVSGSGYAGVTSYVDGIGYRAFGVKRISNANGNTLWLQYDNRMRVTRWDVPGVMGWNYSYNNFAENTGRVTYAQNLYDDTLDRSYDYDHLGRLFVARTGVEARTHTGQGSSGAYGPYSQHNEYDQWGNITARYGWGAVNPQFSASYTNNRMNGMSYDAAGHLTNDGSQTNTYDATGQQAYASATGLTQSYDGDRLREKKVESGVTTYYLRSTVLGGQVVAEMDGSGAWARGYVYLGRQMLAIQSGGVNWVHQDPVTKSQRVTNSSGAVVSTIDLDPWGGETNRSSNQAFQPHRYTSYTRDGNGGDDAMMRRYTPQWHRFNQPDPYDGSYSLTDPQSFNRYTYTQNDPVNFVDPSGLNLEAPNVSTCQMRNSDGTTTDGIMFDGRCHVGGSVTAGNDPFTLTGAAATLALWNPAGNGGGGYAGVVGGGGVIARRSGGALQNPLDQKEIQRRIAEGKAWDDWYKWLNCNAPIMKKYQAKIDEFLKIGGEAFWWEVGIVIGSMTAVFGSGSSRVVGPVGTGAPLPEEGKPVGLWTGFLGAVGVHLAQKQRIEAIKSDYYKEVNKNCGSKPPNPGQK